MREATAAVILISGLLTRAFVPAVAAEEPQLAEVVVTATRTQTRADDVAASVTIVHGDDIRQRDQTAVSDALRGTPGLDITQFGGPGSGTFASIRGAAPDQVLVLLDGVEVNSPTVGQFDFANLTTDNVDRIEILRGGGGTLRGSSAIGGVINVLTRKGEGPFHLDTSGEAGSDATHHEVASLSGAHGPLALAGTVSFIGTDGYQSINDDYRNFSTVWRGDADLLPAGTLRAFLRYTEARAGLVNFNVAEGIPDPNAYSRDDFFLAKGEWEHSLANGLTYRASTSFVRNNFRFADPPNEPDQPVPSQVAYQPSEIIDAEAQADYLWQEWSLSTAGVEFQEQSAHISESKAEEEDDEVDVESEQHNPNRSNVAAYGQEQLQLLDGNLRGVGGVRYDHYDGFGGQVTWAGSGLYHIQPTDTRLRLGYSQGFRAPTFDELFAPTGGNPNLESEESWEIDFGVTQDLLAGRLRFEPTYFYREVKNLIEEVADQLPGPIGGLPEESEGTELTRNFDARFQGVELISRAQPFDWLTLWANYTYLNHDTLDGVLLNRPRHHGSFRARLERSGVLSAGDRCLANVDVYAVGRRDSADPQDEFEPRQLGGYARTDLALAYRLGGRWSQWTITATVHNLFNRDYQESIGFPAPPARFLIGFRYTGLS